jgi:hypothetical protein
VTETRSRRRPLLIGVVFIAVLAMTASYWSRWAQKRCDHEAAIAFVDAARRGQQARPCAIAVEEAAQVGQQAKGLPTPACPGSGGRARRPGPRPTLRSRGKEL